MKHNTRKPNPERLLLIFSFIYIASFLIIYGSSWLSQLFLRLNFPSPITLIEASQAHDLLDSLNKNNNTLEINLAAEILPILHQQNSGVLYDIGQTYAKRQNVALASKYYLLSVQNEPKNPSYRNTYINFLIDNHLNSELMSELATRHALGLTINELSKLYDRGVAVLSADNPDVITYWCTAAEISPSWSHIQIECASVLAAFNKEKEALNVLKACSNDRYAGDHCRQVYKQYTDHNFTPPGFYCKMISQQGNSCP